MKWREFLGRKSDAPASGKLQAWVVHTEGDERAQMKDIIERQGYEVKEFKRFEDAIEAFSKLETMQKASKPATMPEFITTDLYGDRMQQGASKRLPELVKAIEGKGIGHVILTRSNLDTRFFMINIDAYLATEVPKLMKKQVHLDEAAFMDLARASMDAAKKKQAEVTDRIAGGTPGQKEPGFERY